MFFGVWDSFLDALAIAGELRPMTVELLEGHLHIACIYILSRIVESPARALVESSSQRSRNSFVLTLSIRPGDQNMID